MPGSVLCLVFGLRDGGGWVVMRAKICVLLSFFCGFGWVGGWFGLGGWVRQITPPVDKHIPGLVPPQA